MPSPFLYRLRRLDRALRAHLSLILPAGTEVLNTTEPFVRFEYRAGVPTNRLIVFLPGIGDLAEDFERHGFIDEIRHSHGRTDAIAIDAHVGYYRARSVIRRITDDVIVSARAAGYTRIWLVGISMGGFGAAYYATQHSAALEGVVLLAPYLGAGILTNDIKRAGGVRRWHPGEVAATDHARQLWAWIRAQASGLPDTPRIYLGYGSSDRFAPAHRLLGDVLPDERVFVIPGGHDWRTWKRLWRQFLDRWPAE